MKYFIINIVLHVPKSFGIVSGVVLKSIPYDWKEEIAETGRVMISRSLSKLRPVLYFYFYELIKHMSGRNSLVLYKDIGRGIRMKLDISKKTQRQIFLFDKYEEPTRFNIENQLKPGDMFIDIGANVGYYTLIGSTCVRDIGKVITFEPEEENFKALNYNISLNKLENVITEHKAVGDSNGKQKLYLNPLNEGGHSLLFMSEYSDNEGTMKREDAEKKFPSFSFEQEIETVSLDKYLSNHTEISKIAVIKIDVEGFEESVIKGMKETLEKGMPDSIICEINHSDSLVVPTLRSYGYDIYTMDRDGQAILVDGKIRARSNYLFKKRQ